MRHAYSLFAAAIVLAGTTIAALAGPATLSGAVTAPVTPDEATLSALPAQTLDISFETSNGKESGTYTGVLVYDLLQKAGLVNDNGKNSFLKHTLMITGSDGYAVAVAEGELDPKFGNKQVLLAYKSADGKTSFDHLRVLVPGDIHGGRAVSDVVSIEVK